MRPECLISTSVFSVELPFVRISFPPDTAKAPLILGGGEPAGGILMANGILITVLPAVINIWEGVPDGLVPTALRALTSCVPLAVTFNVRVPSCPVIVPPSRAKRIDPRVAGPVGGGSPILVYSPGVGPGRLWPAASTRVCAWTDWKKRKPAMRKSRKKMRFCKMTSWLIRQACPMLGLLNEWFFCSWIG